MSTIAIGGIVTGLGGLSWLLCLFSDWLLGGRYDFGVRASSYEVFTNRPAAAKETNSVLQPADGRQLLKRNAEQYLPSHRQEALGGPVSA